MWGPHLALAEVPDFTGTGFEETSDVVNPVPADSGTGKEEEVPGQAQPG